jgi:hypothetical protein
MPFTPAHAAVAWPLSRAAPRLPVSALIIGTLSPDFEYLVRFSARGTFAHSYLGLFVFCVPLSLVCWGLFERLIRPAVAELLPRGLRGARGPRPSGGTVALAAVAAWVGALSHALWDGITHRGGWAVARIPVLSTVQFTLLGWTIPLYHLLQHISTASGLLIVALWVVRAVRRVPAELRRYAPGEASRSLRVVGALLAISMTAGVINGWRGRTRGAHLMVSDAIVGAMATLVLATLALALGASRQRPPETK